MLDPRRNPAPARQPAALSRRAQGTTARVLYLVHRALQKVSGGRAGLQVYLFCAQPTAQAGLSRLRADPNTAVVPVAPGSPLLAAFPRPVAIIAQRFALGATCYAALVKERFAGYLWLARGAYDEDEVRCRYVLASPGSSVWDFDVYVEPDFRAGRTMARLWKDASARLSEQGVGWSFSRISLFNPASIQSHERLGALYVATGAFAVLGSVQLGLFSTRPYVHLGWRRDHRPVLALNVPSPDRIDELVEGRSR